MEQRSKPLFPVAHLDCVKNISLHWQAVSSPLTGFCLAPQSEILTTLDFSERDTDFKQFLYMYTKMFEMSFSRRFISYLEKSLGTERSKFDALGKDIIRHYPEYRDHIGVNIES